MSFDPSLLAGLSGLVTNVTNSKISTGDKLKTPEPVKNLASSDLSPLSPVSPPKNDKSEHLAANDNPTTNTPPPLDLLEVARQAYAEHIAECPTCSSSWAATKKCITHAELWQLYESQLIVRFGIALVDGLAPRPPAEHLAPKRPNAELAAQYSPPAWHNARDAYYNHRFSCTQCKPTGECTDGLRLKHVYRLAMN